MKQLPGLALLVAPALVADPAGACTTLLVTPGASADGSAIITSTCDAPVHPRLRLEQPAPAATELSY